MILGSATLAQTRTQTNSIFVKLFGCIKNSITTFTFVNEICAETFQGFLTGC